MNDAFDLGSNIPSEAPAAAPVVPKVRAKAPKPVAKTAPVGMPELTKIILEENDAIPPTGLFVSHNGRSYLLMTGVEMDVPDGVLGILNDAIMSMPVIDPNNRKVIGFRDRMRYPYRVVK